MAWDLFLDNFLGIALGYARYTPALGPISTLSHVIHQVTLGVGGGADVYQETSFKGKLLLYISKYALFKP